MEKHVVHFYSEGSRLEGDLFLPSDLQRGEKRPGIVLCHGFTGLRELILPEYAKVFSPCWNSLKFVHWMARI